jgi:dolichol-phosphate mannosyltransferase
MDIDSHEPKTITEILKELESGYDFVIGSRYMKDGKCDYTGYRNFISRYGNKLIKKVLNIDLDEFTTSFRGFNLKRIQDFDLNELKFSGYSFLMEAVFTIHSKGYKITQIPIYFRERKFDKSKMARIELFRAFINLFILFFKRS